MQPRRSLTDGRYGADWWRQGVVYQIYPRSFADRNGDGIGDLPGIIDHLDHVVSLGVDAIWLSPIYPSPGRDVGYDVSDHTAVDPAYGTRGRLRPPGRRGPPPRPAGDPRPGDEPHVRRARLVPVEPGLARRPVRRLVPVGATRPASTPTARRSRPTTGCRSSAGRPGRGSRDASSSTSTRSSREQPDLNWRLPAVEAAQWRHGPRLARSRRRRVPPRCVQRLPQAPRAARQPRRRRRLRRGTARSTATTAMPPTCPS